MCSTSPPDVSTAAQAEESIRKGGVLGVAPSKLCWEVNLRVGWGYSKDMIHSVLSPDPAGSCLCNLGMGFYRFQFQGLPGPVSLSLRYFEENKVILKKHLNYNKKHWR